ncbi:hypothetical protein CEXT_196191 [Caerostris extrusa]|uniref:Uncharacterized protein n=1 Tax=Caerostris extrusa TaxID=172846 RepID=A0AAV4VKG2_CAEEX|nr:hypothetical protein CEXT_196191 [Caerostris extrusa]
MNHPCERSTALSSAHLERLIELRRSLRWPLCGVQKAFSSSLRGRGSERPKRIAFWDCIRLIFSDLRFPKFPTQPVSLEKGAPHTPPAPNRAYANEGPPMCGQASGKIIALVSPHWNAKGAPAGIRGFRGTKDTGGRECPRSSNIIAE